MDNIQIEEKEDMIIFHIDGTLTSEYMHTMDKFFNSVNEHLAGNNVKTIAINFMNIYQVDSIGLGYLVKLLKQLDAGGIDLILYDLNTQVSELMELSTLDGVFNIKTRGTFEFEYLSA